MRGYVLSGLGCPASLSGAEDMAGRWLLRIARLRLIDHHRHRRRLRFLRLLDTTPAPSADSGVHLILADAVELGTSDRDLVAWRAAGMGYHELAALTGRSEVSLREAHTRALPTPAVAPRRPRMSDREIERMEVELSNAAPGTAVGGRGSDRARVRARKGGLRGGDGACLLGWLRWPPSPSRSVLRQQLPSQFGCPHQAHPAPRVAGKPSPEFTTPSPPIREAVPLDSPSLA